MIVRIKAVPGQPTIALQKATGPDYYESIIYVNQIKKKKNTEKSQAMSPVLIAGVAMEG